MNYPAKWLQHLLYVQIAAVAVSLFSGIPILGGMTRWVGRILTLGTVYLLSQLGGINGRYQKAAIFSAISLVAVFIEGSFLTLVGLVCSIIASYQEYHAHGELLEDQDPKLAGKWNFLFWLEMLASLALGLLTSTVTVILSLLGGLETALGTLLTTGAISILSFILQIVYLVYLHRTVKRLENEFVM
jgi:hypothetical protein